MIDDDSFNNHSRLTTNYRVLSLAIINYHVVAGKRQLRKTPLGGASICVEKQRELTLRKERVRCFYETKQ